VLKATSWIRPDLQLVSCSDWGQGVEDGHVLAHVVLVVRQGVEHLGGALRVRHHAQLLVPRVLHYVVHVRRHVVLPHLVERVSARTCRSSPGSRLRVLSRVLVTSGVAHPDVVSSFSKNESGRLINIVHQPAVRRIKDSVLKVNWSLALGTSVLSRDPV